MDLDPATASVDLGNLDFGEPWCDPLVPIVLSLLHAGDCIIDVNGDLLAIVPEPGAGGT